MYFKYIGFALQLGKHANTENIFSQIDLDIFVVRN